MVPDSVAQAFVSDDPGVSGEAAIDGGRGQWPGLVGGAGCHVVEAALVETIWLAWLETFAAWALEHDPAVGEGPDCGLVVALDRSGWLAGAGVGEHGLERLRAPVPVLADHLADRAPHCPEVDFDHTAKWALVIAFRVTVVSVIRRLSHAGILDVSTRGPGESCVNVADSERRQVHLRGLACPNTA